MPFNLQCQVQATSELLIDILFDQLEASIPALQLTTAKREYIT